MRLCFSKFRSWAWQLLSASLLTAIVTPGWADVSPAGAFTTSIDIEVPPFRGLAPGVSVQYNSQGGNGDLGVGWRLVGLSEIRAASATKGLPQGTADDVFVLDGNELVPCPLPGLIHLRAAGSPSCKYRVGNSTLKAYTSRIESYVRIAFDSAPSGGNWIVWDRSGAKFTYLPARRGRLWRLSRVEDALGNAVTYHYALTGGSEKIESIQYNQTVVRFYWESRPDVVSFGIGTELDTQSRRLRTVEVLVEGERARAYGFQYSMHPTTRRSNLNGVSVFGRNAQVDSSGRITGTPLPPAAIEYGTASPGEVWAASATAPTSLPGSFGPPQTAQFLVQSHNVVGGSLRELKEVRSGDFDGDGRADVLVASLSNVEPGADTSPPDARDVLHFVARLANQEWKQTNLSFTEDPVQTGFAKTWIVDANGDGFDDVLVVSWRYVEDPVEGSVFHLTLQTALSRGDGSFAWSAAGPQSSGWTTSAPWAGPFAEDVPQCSPGDFNGDGRSDFSCVFQDMRASYLGRQSLGVALARAGGGFQFAQPIVIANDPGTRQLEDPSTALIESNLVLPFETRRLAVGDSNRDGLDDVAILDLKPTDVAACAALGDPTIYRPNCTIGYELLLGLSNGSNFELTRVPTDWTRTDFRDWYPNFLAAADLNGDGRADFVNIAGPSKRLGSQKIDRLETAIVRRDGSVQFRTQTIPAAVARDVDLGFGDADGDGRTDLMVATAVTSGLGCSGNAAHPLLTIARSRGDGTFDLPAAWNDCSLGTQLTDQWAAWPSEIDGRVQIADSNGDGLSDFIFARLQQLTPATSWHDPGSSVVSIYDRVSESTGKDTHRWMATDISGDGRSDFIHVAHELSGNRVVALRQSPSGLVASRGSLPDSPNSSTASWKVADFDGDGRADLAHLQTVVADPAKTGIQLFRSRGDGQFDAAGASFTAVTRDRLPLAGWRVGDLDVDGHTDLFQPYVALDPQTNQLALFVKSIRAGPNGTWKDDAVAGPISVAPLPSADYVSRYRSWHVADVNGDGRPELVYLLPSQTSVRVVTLTRSSGGSWDASSTVVANPTHINWLQVRGTNGNAAWHTTDINGDGLSDFVRQLATPAGRFVVHTLLSNGNGSFTPIAQSGQLPSQSVVPNTAGTLDWQVVDANSDGLADFVQLAKEQGSARATILYSRGTGYWDTKSTPVDSANSIESADLPGWQAADLSGDGLLALVRMSAHQTPAQPRLDAVFLESTKDVIRHYQSDGPKLTIDYGGASSFVDTQPFLETLSDPMCRLPLGATVTVVTGTRIEVGGESYTSTFSYSCARWSRLHRMFLGWAEQAMHVPAAVNRPGRSVHKLFHQTDECLTQPSHVFTRTAQGNFVGFRQTISYAASGNEPPFACLPSYVHDMEYSSTNPTQAQNHFTNLTYDEFGNVSSILHDVPALPGGERISQRSYKHATGPFIVDNLAEEQLRSGRDSSGKLLKATIYCYDGDTTFTCNQPVSSGQLTQRLDIWEQGTRKTDYLYDPAGNLAGMRDANNNGTAIFFDAFQRIYPDSEVNAMGQTRLSEWDRVLGVMTKSKDANGSETSFAYDEYGRLIEVSYSTGIVVRRNFLDWDDVTKRRVREEISAPDITTIWTEQHIDALNRVTRIDRSGRSASEILTQLFEYRDGSQLPYRIWAQETSSAQKDALNETFFYDEVGRLTSIRHSPRVQVRARNASRFTYGYALRRFTYGIDGAHQVVASIDENGLRQETLSDPYGRIVETRSYEGSNIVRTRYEYDARDRLITVVDPNGNATRYEWDMLSRQKFVDDPNLGKRTKTYDLVGNLLSVTDARNRTTTLAYDALNRLTSKRFPNNQTMIWRYDEAGHGAGIGRLTSTTDLTSSGCPQQVTASYQYDPSGRLVGLDQCVEGAQAKIDIRYDSAGRPATLVYPDGETVAYSYNDAGWVTAATGYVDDVTYDPRGRVGGLTLANGVKAEFAFDRSAGDIASELYFRESSNPVYAAAYKYALNGTMLGSTSPTNGMNLTYVHDELKRLRSVSGDHQQDWTYDAAGNMLSNSAVGLYSYPPQGPNGCAAGPCPRPHAAQSVGPLSFHYDANGQLSWVDDSATGQMRSIDWTFDGMPMVVQDFDGTTTHYSYDAFGHLVKQISPTETIVLFNPFVAHSSLHGWIKNYYVGRRRIATRMGAQRFWLHSDRAGSVRALSDDAGLLMERIDYTPFGKPLSVSQYGTLFRFEEARADLKTGLIYMGARFYDPVSGRFTSPDTVVPDVLNTQATNRYAFAYNSPLLFVDPDGHAPVGINETYGASPVPQTSFDFTSMHNSFLAPEGRLMLSTAFHMLVGPTDALALNPDVLNGVQERLGEIGEDFVDHIPEALFGGVTGALEGSLPVGWALPFDTVPDRLGFDPKQAAWFNLVRGMAITSIGAAESVQGAGIAVAGSVPMGAGVVTAETGVGALVGVGGAAVVAIGGVVAVEGAADVVVGSVVMLKAGVYIFGNKQSAYTGKTDDAKRRETEHGRSGNLRPGERQNLVLEIDPSDPVIQKLAKDYGTSQAETFSDILRGAEQWYMEHCPTCTRNKISSMARGNKKFDARVFLFLEYMRKSGKKIPLKVFPNMP